MESKFESGTPEYAKMIDSVSDKICFLLDGLTLSQIEMIFNGIKDRIIREVPVEPSSLCHPSES